MYVMVDTRNLRAHTTKQEGLPHWPAAVASWHSRLQLVGPKQEKTELLFFPACEQSGLHRVHPTWAGTFALAALVALFPGINFIPLDSDCLPVTLFEAADLWKEGYLARFPLGTGRAMPTQHPLHRKRVYLNDPRAGSLWLWPWLLGRTLLRVLVFGTLLSPHFGVQKQSLFSKETMLKPCFG